MKISEQRSALSFADGRRLIDEDGELWLVGDQALRRQLGTTLTGSALVDYVVLNLGWIEVSAVGNRFSIRCRPRLVGQRGLAALFYSLHDCAPSRITLSVFGADWQHSIHRQILEVSTIVGSMANVAATNRAHDDRALLSREVVPEQSPLFDSVISVGARLDGAASLGAIVEPLDAAFRGRWCVCHVDAQAVILDQVGTGFTHFNPSWHQKATGPTLDRYADESYGSWITAQRLQIARSRKPVFDEVDAVVRFPRLGETRLQYARASFPLTLADGSHYVVSAACTDSGINLRN